MFFYRLIRLNDIGKYSKKKVVSDEDDNDSNNSIMENNVTINDDKTKSSSKLSKNETDKMELMMQTIENIDKINSGTKHFISYLFIENKTFIN